MTASASWALPSAFHIWPDVRIIAGIEASTMTSLGTCRLVIPRSESTIARAGPSARPFSTAARMASGEAVVGAEAGLVEGLAVLGEEGGQEGPQRVPEDDGVRDLHHRRLQVQREQDALGPRPFDLGGEERDQRVTSHHGCVEHLAAEE